MTDVLVLLVSLVVILFAAELFTNGIEWMGRKLGLGEGAVGSVLAAVGTAFLPADLSVVRWAVAVVLIASYAWYVKGHLSGEASDHADELAPLRMHPLDRTAHRLDPHDPRLRVIALQVIAAIGLIIVGAVFFIFRSA